jgi:hypothetical protein
VQNYPRCYPPLPTMIQQNRCTMTVMDPVVVVLVIMMMYLVDNNNNIVTMHGRDCRGTNNISNVVTPFRPIVVVFVRSSVTPQSSIHRWVPPVVRCPIIPPYNHVPPPNYHRLVRNIVRIVYHHRRLDNHHIPIIPNNIDDGS